MGSVNLSIWGQQKIWPAGLLERLIYHLKV